MIRIVDGVAYESFATDNFRLKAYDCGHGHMEFTASRVLGWRESNMTPLAIELMQECLAEQALDPAVQAEKAARAAKNSAMKAKKRVRQLCKAMGVDSMLTLTYKANQTDLGLTKKHLREFNRRMLRVMPDFAFVAAFETQKRGAWHVHMATRTLPQSLSDRNKQNGVKVRSYEVIRRIWRSVVGELGGNIDVSRRKFHSRKSSAQIASYIAGYIVKEFENGEKWSNRWTKYGEGSVPEPIDFGYVSTPLQAIELAYSLLPDGHRVAVARLDRWKDWFVLHSEPVSG